MLSAFRLADKYAQSGTWTRGAPRVVLSDINGALGLLKAVPMGDLSSDAMTVAVLNLLQAGHAAAVFLEVVDEDVNGGRTSPSDLFSSLLAGVSDAGVRLRAARESALSASQPVS